MASARALLRRALVSPLVSRLWRHRISDRAAIFMLHRFREPGGDGRGHDPLLVRAFLAEIRRRRYPVLSLREAIARGLEPDGPTLGGALVFTIDDGYRDAATVAAPLFAEFDIPVTTFAVTGFLDGTTWMWWDQVEYLVATTTTDRIDTVLGGEHAHYRLIETGSHRRVTARLVARLKKLGDVELRAGVIALSEALEVPLPVSPPPEFAPMSWEDLRRCETMGMEFGPHTVTHPILSRSEVAEAEIRESWDRLQAEAHRPVPVFCYPNGMEGDFGSREIRAVDALGMEGAVVASSGYAGPRLPGDSRFTVPRFAFPDVLSEGLQAATGLEDRLTAR